MRTHSLILLVFLVLSSPLPNMAQDGATEQAASTPAASPTPPAVPPAPLSDADRAAYFEILMQVRAQQAQENAARIIVLESPAKLQQLLQQLVGFTRTKAGGAPCELDSKAEWQCQGAPTSAKSQ